MAVAGSPGGERPIPRTVQAESGRSSVKEVMDKSLEEGRRYESINSLVTVKVSF